jgi:hypothetical protein
MRARRMFLRPSNGCRSARLAPLCDVGSAALAWDISVALEKPVRAIVCRAIASPMSSRLSCSRRLTAGMQAALRVGDRRPDFLTMNGGNSIGIIVPAGRPKSHRLRDCIMVHNAKQQIVSPGGEPIPRLYAAGELGSSFGPFICRAATSPNALSPAGWRAERAQGSNRGGEFGQRVGFAQLRSSYLLHGRIKCRSASHRRRASCQRDRYGPAFHRRARDERLEKFPATRPE